jgi:hypothetical protein
VIERPPYPTLCQMNIRVRLRAWSAGLDCPAPLDDMPNGALDALARAGFDWL